MNDKIRNFIFIFVLTGCFASLCYDIQLGKSRELDRQYREREQEYQRTIQAIRNEMDGCKRANNAIREATTRQLTSIGELREAIREIRENYEDMEVYINNINQYIGRNDNIQPSEIE